VRFFDTLPFESCTVPQLPLPMPVVNESRVKLEVLQLHGMVVVVVVVPEHGDDSG